MSEAMKNESYVRITDGKGFAMRFANGWAISVQFGWGNYCDNYDFPDEHDFRARNSKAGAQGSRNAECAVFDAAGEMVKLPDFMFDDPEYADIVSNSSTSSQVLQLMNWAAEQSAATSPNEGGNAE
jgi:hypothetical protein